MTPRERKRRDALKARAAKRAAPPEPKPTPTRRRSKPVDTLDRGRVKTQRRGGAPLRGRDTRPVAFAKATVEKEMAAVLPEGRTVMKRALPRPVEVRRDVPLDPSHKVQTTSLREMSCKPRPRPRPSSGKGAKGRKFVPWC